MKKGLAVITILALLVCALGASAQEEGSAEPQVFTSGDYEYILLDDGSAEITYYKGTERDLSVPAQIDGFTVSSIGTGAFFHNETLFSVELPNSLTGIGEEAFSSCEALQSVSLPDSLASIGNGAFSFCYSLNSITIPDSVVSIGRNPFERCDCLTRITVSPDSAFAVIDGVLFEKSTKRLICYPCAFTAPDYCVPEGILSIGARAFSFCSSLRNISLPDSLVNIETLAFSQCTSLNNVILPDSLTSIGDFAFHLCSSLNNITLPDSLTSIGNGAFSGCRNLKELTLPDSLTNFGGTAVFFGCHDLTLTVGRDSYARSYARENHIPYTYADANDWLTN